MYRIYEKQRNFRLTFTFAHSGCLPLEGNFGQLARKRKYLFKTPYIRLTYLIPELLQLVDDGKIALTPAVELSYLPEKVQTYLLEEIRRNDCTPSLSQAIRMKKL